MEVSDEHEQAIAQIARSARDARPRSSRTLWIAGLVMGAVCIAGFVAFMLAEPGTPDQVPALVRDGRYGFASGLAIGLAVGIAIGFAIARQRRAR